MIRQHEIKIWQVDAFAEQPFSGNPAAVCLLDEYPGDDWLQHVAAEMNLSETAFAVPKDRANHFQLRWFTPASEVDLCGHATLALTHVLLEEGIASTTQPIRFESRSGELVCTRNDQWITLDFPATPPEPCSHGAVGGEVASALGITETVRVLKSRFDLVVVLDDEESVLSLTPDFNALVRVEARGVIVTARCDRAGIDFVSRFFAPKCDVNEDPVTGSAHCCLAPYWAEQLGRTELVGYQASRRGGKVRCEVIGDRVRLSGGAVTVLEGKLLVRPT